MALFSFPLKGLEEEYNLDSRFADLIKDFLKEYKAVTPEQQLLELRAKSILKEMEEHGKDLKQ